MLAALLFFCQSADPCVRELESDDIAARERAVLRLIALNAEDAVRPLLAADDAEVRGRAEEIVAAIRFFRGAPGLRAAWRYDPSLLPTWLLRDLAGEPRQHWPLLIDDALGARSQRLPADVRSWLAHDVLAGSDAGQQFATALAWRCTDVDEFADASTLPSNSTAPWWCCLEALAARSPTVRQVSAVHLGSLCPRLPLRCVDEIAARLIAALGDRQDQVRSSAAHALAAVAHRFIVDPLRLRRLLERVSTRFDVDGPAGEAALEVFSRAGNGRPEVMRQALEVALGIVRGGPDFARHAALLALYRLPLKPGEDLDLCVRASIAVVDRECELVRRTALLVLRDRAPQVEDGELFAAAFRAILGRLQDPQPDSRLRASGAVGYVARKRANLSAELRREAREALENARRVETWRTIREEQRHSLDSVTP